jgi:hypothetical protein
MNYIFYMVSLKREIIQFVVVVDDEEGVNFVDVVYAVVITVVC